MSSINPTESVINSISKFSEKSNIKEDSNQKSFNSLLDEHLITTKDDNATATLEKPSISSNDRNISNKLTRFNEENNSKSTLANTQEKPATTVKTNNTSETKAIASNEENKNDSINPNIQAELLIANNNFTHYNPDLKRDSALTNGTTASIPAVQSNAMLTNQSTTDSIPAAQSNAILTNQSIESLLKTSSNTQNNIAPDINSSVKDLKSSKHAIDIKESSLGSTPAVSSNTEATSQSVATTVNTSSNTQNAIASNMSRSGNDLNIPSSATLLNNATIENQVGADISKLPISNNASTANYQISTNLYQPGWTEAFNQRVIFMGHNNINSASISINPEHLGPIQVQLQMNANQQTSIHFVVNNPDVRQIINDSIQQLGAIFDQSGIQLGQTSVSSQSKNSEGREQKAPRESVNNMTETANTDGNNSSNSSSTTITKHGLINTYV